MLSVKESTPCNPDPCGINADCTPIGTERFDCTCIPGYFGNPYAECRPECTINSDCPKYLACVNQKCVDPCPGSCGINALCNVVNHDPYCSCPRGYSGDAFVECRIREYQNIKFLCLNEILSWECCTILNPAA